MTTAPTKAEVDKAADKAEEPKSLEQAEAGDYKKGRTYIHGMTIAIENARGSTRSGKDKNGSEWSVVMPAHYGYIEGTKGNDKDRLDAYIGKNPKSEKVWVVNQAKLETSGDKKVPGSFDEHKIFIGFDTQREVVQTYDKAFNDGLGPLLRVQVLGCTIDELKDWIKNGDTTQPFELSVSEAVDMLLDDPTAMPAVPRLISEGSEHSKPVVTRLVQEDSPDHAAVEILKPHAQLFAKPKLIY